MLLSVRGMISVPYPTVERPIDEEYGNARRLITFESDSQEISKVGDVHVNSPQCYQLFPYYSSVPLRRFSTHLGKVLCE